MSSLLIVATGNQHKVDEINAILAPSVTCVSMRTLGDCPELAETGKTFEENAAMKVEQLSDWMRQKPTLRFPVDRFKTVHLLADDSGLEVDALGGAPGVYSARYANTDSRQGNASDWANNDKLLRELAETPLERRTARFRCVLALMKSPRADDRQIKLFSGHCEGVIATETHGTQGFGYDPLFYPVGQTRSFGELGSETKNQISHRACALKSLETHIKGSS
jgi:XTP/dITP diphosphohydrolase